MSYLLDKDDKTITQDAWDTVRYYEELNTTNFPIIEPNVIRKLRQRKMMAKNLVYSSIERIENLLYNDGDYLM